MEQTHQASLNWLAQFFQNYQNQYESVLCFVAAMPTKGAFFV